MTKSQHVFLGLLTLVIAAVILGIGYLVGISTQVVEYAQVSDVYITHYISGNDDNHHVSYFQLEDNRLFYIHEQEFSPPFSAAALGQSGHVSFTYRADSGTSIDVTSTSNTHLAGTAYRVIAITALDTGQQVYATDLFTQHTSGFTSSRQDVAYLIYGVAVLVAISALVFRGRGPIMAAAIAGGAVALPIAWVLLINFIGGDMDSGSSGASQQIFIAKAACAVGALAGAVIGAITVLGMRESDQAELRRKQRRAKRAGERRQRETQASAALRAAPTNWAEWSNRGNYLDTLHRYDEALQAYDRALADIPANHPMLWTVLNNKAEALKNAKRNAEALQVSDRAYALQPHQIGVLRTRGILLLRLGRNADAVPIYEEIVKLAPNDVTAINNLSVALAQTGRRQEAIRMSESALQIDPDNRTARNNRDAFQRDPSSVTVREVDEDA